jgi:lysine N6-hydroxylase
VVADLLDRRPGGGLSWFTRSRGFLPMEYSKLGLEHFTPEYTDWFHGLPEATRDDVRGGQDLLYKGIDGETAGAIYDRLYERSIDGGDPGLTYAAGLEVVGLERTPGAAHRWRLRLKHGDEGGEVDHATDAVVAATGYTAAPLPLADPDVVARDRSGRPVVERDHRVRRADGAPSTLFVQNGELHTHGVGTPDLGLGARRSAVIVNALAGREVYRVPERTVFQRFGTAQLAAAR